MPVLIHPPGRRDDFAISDQLVEVASPHHRIPRPASQHCLTKATSYNDHYPRSSEPSLQQSAWSSASCRLSGHLGHSSRLSGSLEGGHSTSGLFPSRLLTASLSSHPTIGDTSASWDSSATDDEGLELLQVERSGAGFTNHHMLGMSRSPANLIRQISKDSHDKALLPESSVAGSMVTSYTHSSNSICLRSTSSFSGPLSATLSETSNLGRFSRGSRCSVTSTISAVASATHAAHQAASMARASPRLQQVLARSLKYTQSPRQLNLSDKLSKSFEASRQLPHVRGAPTYCNISSQEDNLVSSSSDSLSMLLPSRSAARSQYDLISDLHCGRTSSCSSLQAGAFPQTRLPTDTRCTCTTLLTSGEILPGSTSSCKDSGVLPSLQPRLSPSTRSHK